MTDFDLIQESPDIVFKCTSCGQEVIVKSTDIDLGQSGDEEVLDVALYLAEQEHSCPSPEPPDVTDLPEGGGSLEGQPLYHIGPPLELQPDPPELAPLFILTDKELTTVFTDSNVVGFTPFFTSQQEAMMTAQPYRARVWRLEEVE